MDYFFDPRSLHPHSQSAGTWGMEQAFVCRCGEKFDNEPEFTAHEEGHNIFTCLSPGCPCYYQSEEQLAQHILTHFNEPLPSPNNGFPVSNPFLFSPYNFNYHTPAAYASASPDDFQYRLPIFACLFEGCERFFASAEDLQSHTDEHTAAVKCPEAGCIWPDAPVDERSRLCSHMTREHGICLLPLKEIFLCQLRGCEQQVFLNRWNLNRHKDLHIRAMGGAGKKAEPEPKADFDFLASLF
ncbi:hypothetical protein BKA56DRAFT_592681 [Ilyonectria sp. MPI-CAGE-AT-0026]|nr:hypothetical protein BKA56DRAFT_592681 [Ilyonectria sp. MPI-CAGE-AT-0026]